MSAWAQANHLVLARQAVDLRTHELAAMPKLWQIRDLANCMVTRDQVLLGWGCQTRIAPQIQDQEADCVLAVKGTPKARQARIPDTLAYAQTQGFTDGPHDDVETVYKDHGRVEIRRCGTIGAPDYGRYVDPHQVWADLQSRVMVESARRCREQTTREVRCDISRLPPRAATLRAAV